MPYSLTFSPVRTASSRRATLWAFEPVRCCSRLPKHARRHHPQLDPRAVVGDRGDAGLAARRRPRPPTPGRRTPRSAATRSVTAATRSMSLAVSPIAAQAAGDLAAARPPAQASSSARARSASGRSAGDRAPRRGRCAVAVGQAVQDRRLGLLAQARRARGSRPAVAACAHVLDRVQVELGEDPPGRLRPDALDAASPPPRRAGCGRRASSSAEISPVSSSSATLSAIVWPTPGRLVSSPCSDSRATDSGVSRSVLRGPPVGEHAVDDRALQLEQVGHQVEPVGDVGVGERRGIPRGQ